MFIKVPCFGPILNNSGLYFNQSYPNKITGWWCYVTNKNFPFLTWTCILKFITWSAELYALFRYIGAGPGKSSGDTQSITSGTEQDDSGEVDKRTNESELRLAQLQHQLPANEPGTLMHLMEDASTVPDEDEETKSCKNLFRNLKFFLSREVSLGNLDSTASTPVLWFICVLFYSIFLCLFLFF